MRRCDDMSQLFAKRAACPLRDMAAQALKRAGADPAAEARHVLQAAMWHRLATLNEHAMPEFAATARQPA
jgi:hypothetical protein